jgi:hypothetical protein
MIGRRRVGTRLALNFITGLFWPLALFLSMRRRSISLPAAATSTVLGILGWAWLPLMAMVPIYTCGTLRAYDLATGKTLFVHSTCPPAPIMLLAHIAMWIKLSWIVPVPLILAAGFLIRGLYPVPGLLTPSRSAPPRA